MNECLNPVCARLIDGDEPFCSQACETAFNEWDTEMRVFYAADAGSL